MKTYNTNNKFIYDKPKRLIVILLLYLVIFISFIILSFTLKIYSHINVKAIVNNDLLVIPQTPDIINEISRGDKVKIDDKYYYFKVIKYSELYNEGNINLQDITISSKFNNFKENQIIDVTFYYDKELIIKKILKGVFK